MLDRHISIMDRYDPGRRVALVVAEQDGTYYIFCAGFGITVYSSPDMQKWTRLKPVFESPPQRAKDAVRGFGGLESNFKIMVGRADKVTGPYVDKRGRKMIHGGASLVLEGNKDWPVVAED